MLQILSFVFWAIGLVGLVMVVVCLKNKDFPYARIGNLMFAVGLLVGTGAYLKGLDKADRADIEQRYTVTTDKVIQSYHVSYYVSEQEKGCIEYFTLAHTPYIFADNCFKFVGREDMWQWQMPEVGDMMRVTFLLPEEEKGNLELLTVYNLTQELEQFRARYPIPSEATAK